MKTLEELHNAYMKSRDLEDNYNVDDDYEAQQINEYCNTKEDISDIHWQPVARDKSFTDLCKTLKNRQDR